MTVEKNDVNHVLEKSVITGITTGIMASQMFPGAPYVLPQFLSPQAREVPFSLVATGIGAANSMVCDLLHLSIKKGVPLPQKAAELSTFGASIAASAVTMYCLLRLGNANIGIVNSAITGAVGETVGGLGFYYLKQKNYL